MKIRSGSGIYKAIRGGSRTVATSEVEFFVIIGNG